MTSQYSRSFADAKRNALTKQAQQQTLSELHAPKPCQGLASFQNFIDGVLLETFYAIGVHLKVHFQMMAVRHTTNINVKANAPQGEHTGT